MKEKWITGRNSSKSSGHGSAQRNMVKNLEAKTNYVASVNLLGDVHPSSEQQAPEGKNQKIKSRNGGRCPFQV